ncbi:TonB-dependent receptor domain-containing protein [Polycladidibacter stylochi]|uniref:TonB-dependent receptor domain-containing protein n=1 Tax=Polycladidibacter stylochi TaxID=1807766 RepID=UPI00083257DA|nr:TonB-dependent receptor [Pseudovibrio stylochi]
MKTHSLLLLGVSTSTLLLLGAASHSAEQQSSITLDKIVTTAGKAKVAIDTPQAVTVIAPQQIEASQANSLGELLERTPGVSVSNAQAPFGQSFNIRGIGTGLSSDENRMILQVDGVKKYFEQYRMGSFFSDPEFYKSVTIQRGPAGSTLYGSGAMAGVISVQTKDASDYLKGDDKLAVRLKGTWSSNANDFTSSLVTAAKLTDNLELFAAGNFGQIRPYTNGDGVKDAEGNTNMYSGIAKLKYNFGSDKDQSLALSYERYQFTGKNQYFDQISHSKDFGFTDRTGYNQTGILRYENAFLGNDFLNLTAQLSYSNEETSQDKLQNICYGPRFCFKPYGDKTDFTYNTIQYKLENESELESVLGLPLFITYGAEGSWQERKNTRYKKTGTTHGSSSHPEGTKTSFGVYAQAEAELLPGLVLTPGVRIDHDRLQPGTGVKATQGPSDTAYSPKLAVYYDLTSNVGLFASLAHTERLPSIDEAFSGDNYTNPHVKQLKKELSNNIEGGIALSFDSVLQEEDGLRLKATTYYNKIRNHYSRQYNHTTGRAEVVLVNQAQYSGLELEASYDSQSIFADAGLTYTRAYNLDTNNYIDSVEPLNGFIALGFKVPEADLQVKWRSDFYGALTKVSDPKNKAKAYNLHDISLEWTPTQGFLENAEVRASVENIFNTKYRSALSQRDGRGRTFKLSIAKTF